MKLLMKNIFTMFFVKIIKKHCKTFLFVKLHVNATFFNCFNKKTLRNILLFVKLHVKKCFATFFNCFNKTLCNLEVLKSWDKFLIFKLVQFRSSLVQVERPVFLGLDWTGPD
jgi:hypothetical protein